MSTYHTLEVEGTDVDRPDDCSCWSADAELPCFPCYLEGFDVPNPEEPAAEDDE